MMQCCPVCGESHDVMPLVEAMRRDATLRTSEFGWEMESQWGLRPALRAPIGTRRVADQVIGQLKRPSAGMWGALSQIAGVILGVAAAIFAVPLLIMTLFWLTATSVVLLPIFLIGWFAAVAFLIMWATRPRATQSPYRRAILRLADLSYCVDCDTIFETKSGRVVSIDRLRGVLYAEGAGSASVNHLAQRS